MEPNKPERKIRPFLEGLRLGVLLALKSAEKPLLVLLAVGAGAVLLLAVGLRRYGVSLDGGRQAEITVSSEHYAQALEDWGALDYAAAEADFLSALDEETQACGEASPEAAAVSQKLGALYLEMGRYEESYERLNSAYTAFRDRFGENDGNTILAQCQICLYDIQTGDVERGFAGLNSAYEQTKSMACKIQICQMLAQCCTLVGDYSRAEAWYGTLADVYLKLYGTSNVGAVDLCNDFALLMAEEGRYEDAVTSCNAAIAYWDSYSDEEDAVIANVYANLARVYALNDQIDEAKTYSDKALDIQRRLFGADSIHLAMSYEMQASICSALQEPEQQLDYLTRALGLALRTVGENHEATSLIYLDLGDYYNYRGQLDEALLYHGKALEIRKNILGTENINTALVYTSLSADCNSAGDYDTAVGYARRAAAIYETLYGEDSVNTAAAYAAAAWPLANSGDTDGALAYARRALDIWQAHPDDAGSGAAYALQTAGYVYGCLGSFGQAEDSLREALTRYRALYGDCHTTVGNTALYLGDVYARAGRYRDAFESYTTAETVYEQLHPNDPGYLTQVGQRFRALYDKAAPGVPYLQWKENPSFPNDA